MSTNLTEPIRRHAQERPDALALILPNNVTISYRTLDARIDIVASGLAALGVAPGMRIGIQSARPFRDLCCRLALARMGATTVPKSIPAETTALCLVDTDAKPAGVLRSVPIDHLFEASRDAAATATATAWSSDGDAICSLFPTSGTTGSPRFVAVSQAVMAHRIAARSPALRVAPDVRKICTVGAGTAYGFMQRLDVLWSGGVLVLTSPQQYLYPLLDEHRVTHLALAPFTLFRLVKAMPKDAPPPKSLRLIEVGGSALAEPLYRIARERLCPKIVSQYGAAEAGPVASADVASLIGRPGAVGHVYASVDVQVVGPDDRPLPAGSEGPLRIRGPGCADRYDNDPEASAAVFRNGWVYTGDMGSVAADRMLTVVGRATDAINSGGSKINPQTIEDVLLSVAEIEDAAAFGVPDAVGITRIWAAIVATPAVDMEAVRSLCRERLRNAAPTSFLRMKELPRNEAGKVLRDALRKRASVAMARRAAGAGANEAP